MIWKHKNKKAEMSIHISQITIKTNRMSSPIKNRECPIEKTTNLQYADQKRNSTGNLQIIIEEKHTRATPQYLPILDKGHITWSHFNLKKKKKLIYFVLCVPCEVIALFSQNPSAFFSFSGSLKI